MPLWAQTVLAVVLGPVLWLAGAIFFDFVHWVLHVMLRSRWSLLRALAWPHGVHHRWIDRDLEIRWEYQRRNIWCHIVPEYLTQLVFTAGVALLLPLPFVLVLAALQTLAFVAVARERGLDVNHRPIEMLDAYRPGFMTPPAYHALHHVHPDAYFSAYTKVVDGLVGGGAQLRGRRFGLYHATGALGNALVVELRRRGVDDLKPLDSVRDADLHALDVLVLCAPEPDEAAILEAFIDATHSCKLPPETWSVHAKPDDATARHYLSDVRIHYRTLVVPGLDCLSAPRARTAARRALARICRGFHYVSTGPLPGDFDGRRRLRATSPARPQEGRRVRHRTELVPTA